MTYLQTDKFLHVLVYSWSAHAWLLKHTWDMGSIKIEGKLPVTRDRIKKFPSLMARYLAKISPFQITSI